MKTVPCFCIISWFRIALAQLVEKSFPFVEGLSLFYERQHSQCTPYSII